MITQEKLKELLDYHPQYGIFTWRDKRNGISPSRVAGTVNGRGYVTIRIEGKQYYAHRLAWLYMVGGWPENSIYHRNKDKLDNSFKNLSEIRPPLRVRPAKPTTARPVEINECRR